MIDLSVIVVGTNEKDYVFACLKSLEAVKTTYSIETILVDNASEDGTTEMVKKYFQNVRVIRNEKRAGYIINNNTAMRQARGRYFLLVNADIEFLENTLQYMMDFMESHHDVGVSTCKLVHKNGDLQYSCRRFPTPLTYLCRIPHFFHWRKNRQEFVTGCRVKKYLMMDYDHETTREVDWFLSAFFLLRRKAVEEVGLLDENLVQPFYLEDMDWCFRAHLKKWKVYYVPEVKAIHDYQRDSVKKFGRLSIVHLLNILIFFKKHGFSMLMKKHRRMVL